MLVLPSGLVLKQIVADAPLLSALESKKLAACQVEHPPANPPLDSIARPIRLLQAGHNMFSLDRTSCSCPVTGLRDDGFPDPRMITVMSLI